MAETQLTTIHNNIGRLLKEKFDALPKDFNQTRFLQNTMMVLKDVPGIEKMEPLSVARTILKGAFLGLDFLNKECYPIPYGKNIGTKQKPKWIKELQFQTDYKGEVKLAKKYCIDIRSGTPKILDIYAKVVRKEDFFEEFVRDGRQMINFTPIPFNNSEITGAFAVCIYRDGSMIYETMSLEEIVSVRNNYAKKDQGGKFSKAWEKSFGEMAKKTVLRRLCKNIDLHFDSVEQKREWDDSSEFEFKDVTDLEVKEPISMPKEKKLPEKAKTPVESAESDSDGTSENGELDTETGEIIQENEPDEHLEREETDKSGVRTRDSMIADMQSWCKKKKVILANIAAENFHKELVDLDMFELGQLEDIVGGL